MEDSGLHCGDVVSLYKAAFEGERPESHRAAALAPILLNPKGFMEALSEVVGNFTAATFISRIAENPAAPEPIRKAAGDKLRELSLEMAERNRAHAAEAVRMEALWGGGTAKPAAADREMKAKYAEAVKPAQARGRMRVFPIPVITLQGGRLSATLLLVPYRK